MPSFEFEDKYKGKVAGIDEAGRGPWAGPVVAGAAVFLDRNVDEFLLKNLNDSKKLSAKKREELYEKLLANGVCREQARGVLPQNMMVTFWGTVDLSNLLHFLELRDSEHAQWEIKEYAVAIKKLIKPYIPNVAAYFEKQGQVW